MKIILAYSGICQLIIALHLNGVQTLQNIIRKWTSGLQMRTLTEKDKMKGVDSMLLTSSPIERHPYTASLYTSSWTLIYLIVYVFMYSCICYNYGLDKFVCACTYIYMEYIDYRVSVAHAISMSFFFAIKINLLQYCRMKPLLLYSMGKLYWYSNMGGKGSESVLCACVRA